MNTSPILLAVRIKSFAPTLPSLLLVAFLSACMALVQSPSFTPITMEEWMQKNLFTPVILLPEPDKTKLLMGPTLAESAGRVELYYTEEFVPNATPVAYTLYESNRPLIIGTDILPHWEATNRDVKTERISLVLLGDLRAVELRQNKKHPGAGVAIFELGGTWVVCHWQNVTQDIALRVLTESITLVRAGDVATISAFDRKLLERRKRALESN